jgi:hypothetical protein
MGGVEEVELDDSLSVLSNCSPSSNFGVMG